MAPRDDISEIAVFGIGHNGGPPLDPGVHWRTFCWKKAHKKAWKTPAPRDRARAVGPEPKSSHDLPRVHLHTARTRAYTCRNEPRGHEWPARHAAGAAANFAVPAKAGPHFSTSSEADGRIGFRRDDKFNNSIRYPELVPGSTSLPSWTARVRLRDFALQTSGTGLLSPWRGLGDEIPIDQ